MPFGTITSTSNTFGSISGDVGANVPGTLSGSVGVPGPQGPQGIQGIQGPPGPAGPGSTWGGIAGTLSDQTDLQTALNAKANLAGPVFTGDARAVTPTFGDNDTSIATTAFVQSALLGGTAIARNLEVEVRNQSGVTVPAGSIVYISGATGNKPLITLAQANNDANSAQTIGFVKTAIANNGTGYVIVRGELENIDTSALAEGVQLYLSPTTAGTWTTTKPSAPKHLVYVGICVRAHPTLGTILVAVQNGYELDELHDVAIASKANNDLLTYESSTNLWKNKSFGTLGLLTSSALTGYATQSFVAANYAPIAAGVPNGGTVGQVLTKQSGTDFDAAFATLIPGDRYLTTSSTSNTIGTGTKTFTVGTGLSYSSQQDVVISFDASNHMHALVTSYNSGTGALVVNVQSVTGSGTYTAWTINVGGTTPLQSVEWGEILGTLGDQSDLASALSAKLETSTAASTYAALAGATFTGEVVTPASTTSNAGLTITPGVAPSTPTNGEIWATTNDLQVRLNGVTETLAEQSWVTAQGYITSSALTPYVLSSTAASTYQTQAGMSSYALLSGATFTGLISTLAPTTATAGLRLPHGTAPTTPTNGDLFTTTSGLFARINGATRQYVDFDGTQTINGAKTFSNANLTLGNSTAAGTISIGTGATISGSTKAILIGPNGVAGSTTSITVGSTTGTSTTTLQGTTNGVTVAADTNSVALATTAFVVGQASAATPLVDGTAAVGTSLRYARADHVHPTDTSRAPLNSPVFSGTPSLPTGTTAVTQTAGNNTTAVATTAFVTAAVPAVATTAQIVSPSSTTAMMTPDGVRQMLMFPGFQEFYGGGSTATSGAGATVSATANRLREYTGPSASTAGYSTFVFDTSTSSIGFYGSVRGGSAIGKNYARRFWFGARTFVAFGDANNLYRNELGGRTAVTANGDPTTQSIGWKVVGGGGNAIVFYIRTRPAVNGGTYSETTTTFTPLVGSPRQWFDWYIVHDGSNTSQMYVNDVLVGTLTASFSGSQEDFNLYSERIEQTASAATQMSVLQLPTRVFFSQ